VDYLDGELLRFTQPGDLNDPFECLPNFVASDMKRFIARVVTQPAPINPLIKKTKANLRRLRKWENEIVRIKTKEFRENPERFSEMFFQVYLPRLNNSVGVFSLSKKWNSTLMWSHYTSGSVGKGHPGFCIGFEREHQSLRLKQPEYQDVGAPFDVIYSKERLKADLSEIETLPENIFVSKHEDWCYEDEVRIVAFLGHANRTINRTPPLLPVYLFRVPHETIREIIVGINSDVVLKNQLVDFAKQLSVPIFQAQLSISNYDLKRIPITSR
jgi:hypothetical protein